MALAQICKNHCCGCWCSATWVTRFNQGPWRQGIRLHYALPYAGYFQRSSYSAKQLEFRSTLRAGIYEGIEGYLSAPITHSHIQDVSSNEHVRHADAWNLADIAFGAQYQVIDESADRPAISLTFDLSAPTGRKRYNHTFNSWKDPLNNSGEPRLHRRRCITPSEIGICLAGPGHHSSAQKQTESVCCAQRRRPRACLSRRSRSRTAQTAALPMASGLARRSAHRRS